MENIKKNLMLFGFLIKQNLTKTETKLQPATAQDIEILENYEDKNTKVSIKDFIDLYNSRYALLQNILRARQELQSATTIRKVQTAGNNDNVVFIAQILEKKTTKNGNTILLLEDQTAVIKGIINKKNQEMHKKAQELTEDEIIGAAGTKKDNIVFINSVVSPDTPLSKELKKSPEEGAAVFISDLHIGSKSFLKHQLNKFFLWINQNTGTDTQKKLAEKVKYLFVLGDLVDGVGVYPGQEKDLEICDINQQYKEFESYVLKVPEKIKIIICPGNHDSLRIAEPQPPLPKEICPNLYNKKNIFFVSSPSIVRISKTNKFSGLDILIYHGFSFPFFADRIDTLRQAGGLENTDNIMKFLLKKRHLAPTHGSTQYQLGYDTDPLVIKTVPDFFVSGHIHRASIKNHKNISLLNCSCWILQTEYQEKRGLVPQPARAIYVDLKTREGKILNFME